MNRQLDWAVVSKGIARGYFAAPIVPGEMDNASWLRAFNFNSELRFTAEENFQFTADVHSLDNAQVDSLNFEMLADDAEWEAS